VSTILEAAAYAADGTRRRHAVQLPTDPFDGRVHQTALHDAVRAYLANQRQGTASTKIRKFVTGGNQKPWKQKGTGRARQGSIRSPLWPGGGTAFGPTPRDYRVTLPRKVRQLALRSALSARALEQSVYVIEPLVFPEPRTRLVAELLAKMALTGKKVLLLTHGDNRNAILSARNIPEVTILRYQDTNPYEVLHADVVVIEAPALGPLADGADLGDAPVPEPKARKAAAERTPKPAKAPAKKAAAPKKAKAPVKKAAVKAAAKKPAAKKATAKKPSRKKD
jgi:large subunit ribosomal protein L4